MINLQQNKTRIYYKKIRTVELFKLLQFSLMVIIFICLIDISMQIEIANNKEFHTNEQVNLNTSIGTNLPGFPLLPEKRFDIGFQSGPQLALTGLLLAEAYTIFSYIVGKLTIKLCNKMIISEKEPKKEEVNQKKMQDSKNNIQSSTSSEEIPQTQPRHLNQPSPHLEDLFNQWKNS